MSTRDACAMGFRDELAKRIAKARAASGLRQRDISEPLGARDATVSDWENARSTPTPETIVSLARLLGVSVQWLMTGEDAAPPAAAGMTPELRAFLDSPLGQGVSDGERAFLAGLPVVDSPLTEDTYRAVLVSLRGTR